MRWFRRKRRATSDPTVIDLRRVDSPDIDLRTTDSEAASPVLVLERPSPIDEFEELLDREWDRLGNAGTWWFAGERLAIAHDARLAMAGEAPSGVLPSPVEEATRRIATDAAGIRGIDVARWEFEGLDSLAYIELAGVVARVVALDITSFGLGLPLRPLPEPKSGEPTREKPGGAAITTGWAPTIGPATARTALSAVPAEADAALDIQRVLFPAPDDESAERDITGLSRSQRDLVGARTSRLHDCYTCLFAHTSNLWIDLTAVGGVADPRPIVTGVGDAGVADGAAIIAFADAVVLGDTLEYPDARHALEQCLDATTADHAAMAAGYVAMVNRLADAVGAPVERELVTQAVELGVAIPAHLHPR